jgi:RNA polymerase sigma-70 factor (ECF subfamily)
MEPQGQPPDAAAVHTEVVRQRICTAIPQLKRYARYLARTPHDADDLLQDSLLRAIRKLHLWRPDSNLMGWLSVVMLNVHRSRLSYSARRPVIASVPLEEFEFEAPDSQEGAMDLVKVAAALEDLSAEHRDVVMLIGVEGSSYDEAAEILRVPVGTVRSRLARARECLRQRCRSEGINPTA